MSKSTTTSTSNGNLPALATILSGALAIFLVLVLQETHLLVIAGVLACVLVYLARHGAEWWYNRDKKVTRFEKRGLQTFDFFALLTYYVMVQFGVVVLHFITSSHPLPSIPTICLVIVCLLFFLIVIMPYIINELTKHFKALSGDDGKQQKEGE